MRRQLLSVLDAAYAVDVDDVAWHDGPARALHPLVGDGHGSFAWRVGMRDGRAALDCIFRADMSERHADAIAGIHIDASPTELELVYAGGTRTRWTTLAQEFGPERYATSP